MAKRAAKRPAQKARAIGKPRVITGKRPVAFDAGKSGRRLKGVPTNQRAINSLIRSYGKTVVARSRYLVANNPYAAAAKDAFVAGFIGDGIKPSWLTPDRELKKAIQQAFLDWTDESDADGLTDFYGQQATIASEMFEAGECFVRLRPRLPEDRLSVPLQLQLLPSEMLDLGDNHDFGKGGRIECGIEFDAIGRRVAYHFWRQHPGDDVGVRSGEKTVVPASEILHLFNPIRAGQIRGVPHTVSVIAKAAMFDQYDDAELDRKKNAALFAGFVKRPSAEDAGHPLEGSGADTTTVAGAIGLEPGAMIDLEPGEDVAFAEPADVGTNYEVFQYRTLTALAAGMGVSYADMTGDLRQTSYGSQRAGMVAFRRRMGAMQHRVMVFQFCRAIGLRWIEDAALAGAIPVSPSAFETRRAELSRIRWIPPKWDWIDPLKDLQAEKLAVDNRFKARSDVIEASGYDAEETDQRIADDQDRAAEMGIELPRPDGGGTQVNPADSPEPDNKDMQS